MPRVEHRHLAHVICNDEAVREFITDEFWHIGPYSVPEYTKTARQIFAAARQRFGRERTRGVSYWIE
jgi:hypothetical protein